MEEKNRFSKLLEQLLSEAEIKNYTLAKELQYDVSYISKWISGRMIPAEKTERRVLNGISHCIVSSASEVGLASLLADYNLEQKDLLEMAIYDHLLAEYNYVREQEKNARNGIGLKTTYYPELSISQYLAKKRHPVLRRVKSLKIISQIDLMALDYESRMRFVSMDDERVDMHRAYPDVHFSLIINIKPEKWDYIRDTIFLINIMASFQHIDFRIYSNSSATGCAIFVVRNEFLISGMLDNNTRCISVVVSEEGDNCNVIYDNLRGSLSQESLVFQKIGMREFINGHEYLNSLLAPNLRWILGHLTEHFLTDRLFETILERAAQADAGICQNRERILNFHRLCKGILETTEVRLIVCESAFSEWIVSNQLDFYGVKISLDGKEKCDYLENFVKVCSDHGNIKVKMAQGKLDLDFSAVGNQCVFLSDRVSCLRTDSEADYNQILLAERADIQFVLDHFFASVWEQPDDVLLSEWPSVKTKIDHTIAIVRMVNDADSGI